MPKKRQLIWNYTILILDTDGILLNAWLKKIDAFVASINGGVEIHQDYMGKYGVLDSSSNTGGEN